jgi:hypothetical protein
LTVPRASLERASQSISSGVGVERDELRPRTLVDRPGVCVACVWSERPTVTPELEPEPVHDLSVCDPVRELSKVAIALWVVPLRGEPQLGDDESGEIFAPMDSELDVLLSHASLDDSDDERLDVETVDLKRPTQHRRRVAISGLQLSARG